MRRVLSILTLVLLTGCNGLNGRVLVVDSANKPVEGAVLVPVAGSLDGRPATTNNRGEGWISYHVGLEKTQRIRITKPGFDETTVDVAAQWPEKVTLQSGN